MPLLDNRWPFFVFAFFLFAPLLLAGCEKTVTVSGKVAAPMVALVQETHPDRIIITSSGGDIAAALDLADFVRAHRVAVTAMGYCASACAQYVFPAGSGRTMARGTLLVFHNSATATQAIVSGDREEAVRHFFDHNSMRERALYRELGIDPRLLLLPTLQMHTTCYEILRESSGAISNIRFRSTLAGWSASATVLRAANFTFFGSLPDSRTDFDDRIKWKTEVPASLFEFDTAWTDMSFDQIKARLARTPRCD